MYTRILVGTDGSSTADRAVERAVDVAGATGATLTILSAGSSAKAERAVAEAEAAGSLSGFIASLIARAVESVPPWLLLETLDRVRGFLPDG